MPPPRSSTSPLHSPQSSRPSSPLLTSTPQRSLPFIPPLAPKDGSTMTQRRLLIPAVRPATPVSQQHVKGHQHSKSRSGKLNTGKGMRSGSVGLEAVMGGAGRDWVGALGKMRVVEEQMEVRGFQMYAVEKWVVERGRLVNVVCVHTGDAMDKILVTVASPFASLSESQAQIEFDKALHSLRRDGARPRETEQGILMVTSLANFRSDYNLVHIPDGNFLAVREQLYVNVNLLRMGCSGRSTLTLSEPSEPTKDRYLHMYCFSQPIPSKVSFNHCVLELVKLVQSALALFGFFDLSPEERNGLLCDVTAEGITRWTDAVGEPLLSLEPMERVGDPSVVSALLSLVVTMRNRLHTLGFTQVPKDPFQDPQGFMQIVSHFQSQAQKISSMFSPSHLGILDLVTVEYINNAFERTKSRGSDYNVPRMIMSKIDGLTTELNLRGSADSTLTGHVYPTSDLTAFVGMMVNMGAKDVVESLKALWTMKNARKKRTRLGFDFDEEEKEKTDGKSTEDDESSLFPSWGRHMKIDGFKSFDFGIGRSKKPSVDLTSKSSSSKQNTLSADEAPPTTIPRMVPPQLVISGESGNENSPHSALGSSLGLSPAPSPHSSNANLDSAVPRHKNLYPTLPKRVPSRFSTVSDPLTSTVSSFGDRYIVTRHSSAFEPRIGEEEEMGEEDERKANRGLLLGTGRRRHSMEDLNNLQTMDLPSVERMKIDVGLCGQYLIMHRRKEHLRNIIALLQQLNSSLCNTTSNLDDELSSTQEAADAVTALREDTYRGINFISDQVVEWSNRKDEINHQISQLDSSPLWSSVREQRGKVIGAREIAFPAPHDARPPRKSMTRTHFRVQGTLDPEELRLVDWLGRTQSETEEEAPIPEDDVGMPQPFEDMKAWAAATAKEEKVNSWWRWWPFNSSKDPGSDDDTTPSAVAGGEDH